MGRGDSRTPSGWSVLADTNDMLGEGPVWWRSEDALVWVDILDCEIHVVDWSGNLLDTFIMPETVGCVFEQPDGSLIAGCGSGLRTVPDGRLLMRLPETPHPVRVNDGKTDPQGRLVFGTMGHPRAAAGAGALWRYDGERTSLLRTGLTIPNGLDWVKGGSEMLFIDTPGREVQRFAYPPGDEVPELLGTWADLRLFPGVPDGMTVSPTHGTLVAMWGGAQLLQVTEGGEMSALDMPVPYPTSVLLHPHRDAALVTSARHGMPRRRESAADVSGAVLQIDLVR